MRTAPSILTAFAVLGATAASAQTSVHIGPFAGTIALDSHLADYRWDTRARTVWGAAGRADAGPFGAGARIWRASTRQSTGIPGEDVAPEVKLTATELLGEARLARLAGFRLIGMGSVGRLHLGYSPDRLALDDGAGGSIEVAFDPITEWTGGVGLGLRRTVPLGLEASIAVEHGWFRLDTAHRAGDEIVEDRETFGSWTGRVELTHRILRI
jgi:hypothetical protein